MMRKQITSPMGGIGGLLVAILLAAAGGCGNSTTVAGKVTYGGRPVTYGSVIFVGHDKTTHTAVIQPDGSYAVEGLLPGTFGVAVISRDPAKGRSVLRNHKPDPPGKPGAVQHAMPPSGWFPLPEQFESPLSSSLNCTLDAGYVTHDIDLK